MSDVAAAGSSSGKALHVLFADSDAQLIKTHKTLLENKFEMNVQTVVNGNEVVAAYRNGSTYDILFLDQKLAILDGVELFLHIAMDRSTYDILFLDQKLPILDGAEVTKTLRQMKVKSKIVGLYEDFDDDEVNAFIKAGLDVCIKKPLNEEKVKAILLNTVDKKSK